MKTFSLTLAMAGVLVAGSVQATGQQAPANQTGKDSSQQPSVSNTNVHPAAGKQEQNQLANEVTKLQPDLSRRNALSFSLGDKAYSMTIFGQVFVNHSIFGGAYNIGGSGNSHTAQQTQLESARIGVAGNLLKNWNYAIYLANRATPNNPDDNSSVYVRNAYIQYAGFPWATITAGKQNPYWGVDNMHDLNNTYGTNYNMIAQAFAPPISTGLAVNGNLYDQRIDWAAGVYHTGVAVLDNASSARGGQGYQSESRAEVARIGYAPLMNLDRHQLFFVEGSYIHYNGSDEPVASIAVNGDVSGSLTSDSNPPVTAGILAKGTIQDYSDVYNAGFAGQYGPFSIEGGYAWMRSRLDAPTNATSARYHGEYVQAGMVLTGEARAFDPGAGYLLGVLQPAHKYGAFELIGRVSHINLVSNAGENGAAIGDRATDYVLGVNWYLNRHIRFALDGTHLQVSGPSVVVRSGNGATLQAGYVF